MVRVATLRGCSRQEYSCLTRNEQMGSGRGNQPTHDGTENNAYSADSAVRIGGAAITSELVCNVRARVWLAGVPMMSRYLISFLLYDGDYSLTPTSVRCRDDG